MQGKWILNQRTGTVRRLLVHGSTGDESDYTGDAWDSINQFRVRTLYKRECRMVFETVKGIRKEDSASLILKCEKAEARKGEET